jgi:hypothetical protein
MEHTEVGTDLVLYNSTAPWGAMRRHHATPYRLAEDRAGP